MPDQAIGWNPQDRPDYDNPRKKRKMGMDELRAMLAAEFEAAMGALQASKLVTERADALDYYFGHMEKAMPAADGRSSAVSFDVADTVEGLMPSLMEIFAGSDEVVKFDPVGPEDVEAAQQETDYINHVFMNENDGFMILYAFIKDALLSKVSHVKVFWEERLRYESEHYYDLDDAALGLLIQNDDVEIVEHSTHPAHEATTSPQQQMQQMQKLQPQSSLAGPGMGGSGFPPTPEPSATPQAMGSPTFSGQQQERQGVTPPVQSHDVNVGGPNFTESQQPGIGQIPPPIAAEGGGPGASAGPPQELHDVKVVRRRDYSQATVVPVPPEEFVVERGARYSIRKANYCCHKVIKTESELVEMGFDPEQVRNLPIYRAYTNPEEIARDSVDEHQFYGDDVNRSARFKQVLEHYVRMDYEGDGRARLYKVTTSGITGEVLNLSDGGGSRGRGDVLLIDGKPDIEEVDEMPFASMTPIPNTHRYWGRSIADVTMDIQRIKTLMLRGSIDNIALALNPRALVAESGANDTTLDDLLVSRPGGLVRIQQQGAVEFQEFPNITDKIVPFLQYYDTLREWRTGVNRMQQGLDPDTLQPQTATTANMQMSASQQKMKLIARIFAETGIRDLFYLLHGTVRKHSDKPRTVRLRNKWVSVDPRNWKTRNDMTVQVGSGSGGRSQRLAEIGLIGTAQEKLFMNPMLQQLVSPQNVFNAASEMVRAVGHKDVDAFFTDPKNAPPKPQQPPPDPKLQVEMFKAQSQQQLQQAKMQQESVHEKAKLDANSALEQQKFQHEKELALMGHQLDTRKMEAELQMKREQHAVEMQALQQKHALEARQQMVDTALQTHTSQMEAQTAQAQHQADMQRTHEMHEQEMMHGAQQHQQGLEHSSALGAQKLELAKAMHAVQPKSPKK